MVLKNERDKVGQVVGPSTTFHPSFIYPSSILHLPLIHLPSTLHPSLIYSSSILHLALIHPPPTPHPSSTYPSSIPLRSSFTPHTFLIYSYLPHQVQSVVVKNTPNPEFNVSALFYRRNPTTSNIVVEVGDAVLEENVV